MDVGACQNPERQRGDHRIKVEPIFVSFVALGSYDSWFGSGCLSEKQTTKNHEHKTNSHESAQVGLIRRYGQLKHQQLDNRTFFA